MEPFNWEFVLVINPKCCIMCKGKHSNRFIQIRTGQSHTSKSISQMLQEHHHCIETSQLKLKKKKKDNFQLSCHWIYQSRQHHSSDILVTQPGTDIAFENIAKLQKAEASLWIFPSPLMRSLSFCHSLVLHRYCPIFFPFTICLWQCLCSGGECQRSSLLLLSSVTRAASCLKLRSLSLSPDSGSVQRPALLTMEAGHSLLPKNKSAVMVVVLGELFLSSWNVKDKHLSKKLSCVELSFFKLICETDY